MSNGVNKLHRKKESKPSSSQRQFIVAFLLTAIGMGVQFLAINPIYEAIDDILMTGIASGTLGTTEPSEHILFTNVLIGQGLKKLYTQLPTIPWYGLYLIGTHFASFFALAWVSLQLVPHRRSIALLLLYLYGINCHFLYHFSYTSTAYLAAQSGMLLVVYQAVVRFEEKSQAQLILGICLLIFSSMIRLQMFQLVACLAIPWVAGLIIADEKESVLRRWVLPCATMGVIISGLSAHNESCYFRDPRWRDYSKLWPRIAQITDYTKIDAGRLAPEKADKILESTGWSFNDLVLMSAWCFLDPEVYSSKNLESVGTGWYSLQASNLRYQLHLALETVAKLLTSPFYLGCACIMLGLRRPNPWTRNWEEWSTLLLAAGLLIYLSIYRKVPERVVAPIAVFCVIMNILMPRLKERLTETAPVHPTTFAIRSAWVMVAIGTGCLVVNHLWAWRTFKDVPELRQRFSADLRSLAQRQDRMIIAWPPFGIDWISPYDNLQDLSKIKFFVLSALQRTPHAEAQLRVAGIADPVKELTGSDPIPIIAVPVNLRRLALWIQEHTQQIVTFTPIFRGRSGLIMYMASSANSKSGASPAKSRIQLKE